MAKFERKKNVFYAQLEIKKMVNVLDERRKHMDE